KTDRWQTTIPPGEVGALALREGKSPTLTPILLQKARSTAQSHVTQLKLPATLQHHLSRRRFQQITLGPNSRARWRSISSGEDVSTATGISSQCAASISEPSHPAQNYTQL